jgi:hypothetical protein
VLVSIFSTAITFLSGFAIASALGQLGWIRLSQKPSDIAILDIRTIGLIENPCLGRGGIYIDPNYYSNSVTVIDYTGYSN